MCQVELRYSCAWHILLVVKDVIEHGIGAKCYKKSIAFTDATVVYYGERLASTLSITYLEKW